MPTQETHFEFVRHTSGNLPISYHQIDQFSYFKEGMQPVRHEIGGNLGFRSYALYKSAIVFCLPHSIQSGDYRWNQPPIVKIVGDGSGTTEIYAEGVNPPDEINLKPEAVIFWDLSYLDTEGVTMFKPIMKDGPRSNEYEIDGIFTTYILPFMMNTAYPRYGLRKYRIEAGVGSDFIEVVSTIPESTDLSQFKFSLTYVSDIRDRKPIPITTLIPNQGIWKLTIPEK